MSNLDPTATPFVPGYSRLRPFYPGAALPPTVSIMHGGLPPPFVISPMEHVIGAPTSTKRSLNPEAPAFVPGATSVGFRPGAVVSYADAKVQLPVHAYRPPMKGFTEVALTPGIIDASPPVQKVAQIGKPIMKKEWQSVSPAATAPPLVTPSPTAVNTPASALTAASPNVPSSKAVALVTAPVAPTSGPVASTAAPVNPTTAPGARNRVTDEISAIPTQSPPAAVSSSASVSHSPPAKASTSKVSIPASSPIAKDGSAAPRSWAAMVKEGVQKQPATSTTEQSNTIAAPQRAAASSSEPRTSPVPETTQLSKSAKRGKARNKAAAVAAGDNSVVSRKVAREKRQSSAVPSAEDLIKAPSPTKVSEVATEVAKESPVLRQKQPRAVDVVKRGMQQEKLAKDAAAFQSRGPVRDQQGSPPNLPVSATSIKENDKSLTPGRRSKTSPSTLEGMKPSAKVIPAGVSTSTRTATPAPVDQKAVSSEHVVDSGAKFRNTAVAESKLATSAKSKAATSAESKPATSAEFKVATSAEFKPAISAEIKPAISAEIKPAVSAKRKATTSAESKSATSAESKASITAKSKAAIAAKPRTAIPAESKPAISTESKPTISADSKPAISTESKPAISADSKPAANANNRNTNEVLKVEEADLEKSVASAEVLTKDASVLQESIPIQSASAETLRDVFKKVAKKKVSATASRATDGVEVGEVTSSSNPSTIEKDKSAHDITTENLLEQTAKLARGESSDAARIAEQREAAAQLGTKRVKALLQSMEDEDSTGRNRPARLQTSYTTPTPSGFGLMKQKWHSCVANIGNISLDKLDADTKKEGTGLFRPMVPTTMTSTGVRSLPATSATKEAFLGRVGITAREASKESQDADTLAGEGAGNFTYTISSRGTKVYDIDDMKSIRDAPQCSLRKALMSPSDLIGMRSQVVRNESPAGGESGPGTTTFDIPASIGTKRGGLDRMLEEGASGNWSALRKNAGMSSRMTSSQSPTDGPWTRKSAVEKLEIPKESWQSQQAEEKKDTTNRGVKLMRRLRAQLNKMTPATYNEIYQGILQIGIENMEEARQFVTLIFEKAITNHQYIDMYAGLCKDLQANMVTEGINKSVDDFRTLLLHCCQKAFENIMQNPFVAPTDVDEEERFEQLLLYKTKMKGNLVFVSALSVHGLIGPRVLVSIMSTLADHKNSLQLEALSAFLPTVYHSLESSKHHQQFNSLMLKIRELSVDEEVEHRIRCLLLVRESVHLYQLHFFQDCIEQRDQAIKKRELQGREREGFRRINSSHQRDESLNPSGRDKAFM